MRTWSPFFLLLLVGCTCGRAPDDTNDGDGTSSSSSGGATSSSGNDSSAPRSSGSGESGTSGASAGSGSGNSSGVTSSGGTTSGGGASSGVAGAAPVVAILQPGNNSVVVAGQPVHFSAQVSDADDPLGNLVVAWTGSNGAPLVIDGTLDASGMLDGSAALAAGAQVVTLTVTDPSGQTGSASVNLTVMQANAAPTCAISSPVPDEVLAAPFQLVGTVQDADDAQATLLASWASDLGLLGDAPPDASGRVTLDVAALGLGARILTLTATDPHGATCTASVNVRVGSPPVVSITAPGAGDVRNQGAPVLFQGQLAHHAGALNALVLSWASDVDGTLDATPAAADGTATFTAQALSRGNHVVTLSATDADGLTGTASVSLRVNGLPGAALVRIDPASPLRGEALAATVTTPANDPELDPVTYAYAWLMNGVDSGLTGEQVAAGVTHRGETWEVVVTPSDPWGAGAESRASVTIGNTAPQLAGVTLLPNAATRRDTLTCQLGTVVDVDGDAVSVAFGWTVNGSDVATTTANLDASSLSRGDVVVCHGTPSDGLTLGATAASLPVVIGNSVPVVNTVTLAPLTPDENSVLQCTFAASDADGDALVETITWLVNGQPLASHATTLSGSSFNRADVVACSVSVSDGQSSAPPVTSASVTVGNAPPVISRVELRPDPAFSGSTLTCTPTAADADGDTMTYTYAWFVNGAAIAATTATLPGASLSKGNTVSCRATVSDGTATGGAMSSNTITLSNSAPVVSSVTLTPGTAFESSTLTCTPTATDADGDTVTLTYAWFVNGAAIASTTSTLTGASFNAGNTVYCQVTPSDGTVTGTAVSSSAVTISNTAPVISSVSLTPGAAYESSTLTCSASATDADGDMVSFTYAWYVNGSAVAATTATLTGTSFNGGNTVYCRATPSDATATGTAVSSNTITISNTAPVINSVSLTPGTAYEGSTLTCSASATDADGDAVTFTYAWYVNASAVAATGATLTGTSFNRGNTVYCRATPADGTTTGTAVSSSTITISNTAPVMASVSLAPGVAYESSSLTCTASATDDDGDTLTYAYAWYVNGVAVAPTTSTLSGAYFSRNNTVYCSATPSDGTATAPAMSSNAVTISNAPPVLSSVSLTPSTSYEGSTLTCTPSATDADGDTITYAYAWYVNAAAVAATTSTLTGTYFSRGNTVYCRVTPSDGTTTGTALSSSTVTISNSAPVISAVSLTPGTGYEFTTLTCSPTATDADGDTVSFTYAWYVNSTAVAATGSTLTGTYFNRGNTVYCRATPTDGTTAGNAVSSSTVTISNSSPTAPVVAITPSPVEDGNPIVCHINTASIDADPADTVTYTFSWKRDGVAYAGAKTTTTYAGDGIATVFVDQVWECSVTASDGSASSPAATATVTVVAPLFYAGYSTQFGTNSTVGANYLFAEKVDLASAADLYLMGFIGRPTNTAAVRMALYSNNAGAPGTLLGQTAAITPTARVETPILTAPVVLTPGTYWMVWTNSSNLAGYYSATCPTVTTYYYAHTYPTPFPATWPAGASSLLGQCNNIFVGLR